MEKLQKIINKILFMPRLERAVKQAKRWHKMDGKTYIVVLLNGKAVCLSKQKIKLMIATRKFKKGTTIQSIEKTALYKTF